MTVPPLVSVIIPTYNRLELLKEAIRSVQSQTWSSWELIVVDDGSTDGTRDWLSSTGSITTLENDSNLGVAGARNRALEKAEGKYLWFLDDDDLLRPDALEKLASHLARDEELTAAVGARFRFGDGIDFRPPHPRWPMKRMVAREVLAKWLPLPSQIMWRTSILKEAGGVPDIPYGEDRVLLVRIAFIGPMFLDPAIVVDYRVHHAPVHPTSRDDHCLDSAIRAELDALPPERRISANRYFGVLPIWMAAEQSHNAGHYLQGLRDFLRVAIKIPRILLSPILGPRLVFYSLRCVDGILFDLAITRSYRRLKNILGGWLSS